MTTLKEGPEGAVVQPSGLNKTNWKFISIIVILAVIVGGGILGYLRYFRREMISITQFPEIKKPEKVVEEEKEIPEIIVTSDKTEYPRQGYAKFTILNNSPSTIFFPSSEIVISSLKVKLQKYNDTKKIWEEPYRVFLTLGYVDDLAPRHLSLRPGEQISTDEGLEWTGLSIGDAVEPLYPNLEKYRLIIFYYENELCKGEVSYRKNQEVCDKEAKKAFSNEFIIQGAILPQGAIEPAVNFCLEKKRRYFLDKGFFLNFDEDKDKEIIGICWRGVGYDKEGILFVLDKQNNEYKSVLEKEGRIHQRYYTFEDLGIKDIDGDGIDEIIYKEAGWYMGGGDSYLHFYSPKHNEWFWRNDWWEIDIESGERKEGTTFSLNLDLEKYKVFKEFLEGAVKEE